MQVTRVWLADFRNYESAVLEPDPAGLTVISGPNGEGKTNLLEAVGYLATLSSFRGAPAEALVRQGRPAAFVRAATEAAGGRNVLIEAEIRPGGRDRAQLNRQPLRRARELLGVLRVTVFSPDDLVVIKGNPAERRRLLDDVLVALQPRADTLRRDLERILRQRNSLLKNASARGARSPDRLDGETAFTLDVWDTKLVEVGTALAAAREDVAKRLEPHVSAAYTDIAAAAADVTLGYERSWTGDLADAVAASRSDDLRRGVTLVGPHRDDLELTLDGLPARTHASQGEQRSFALALRLAAHRLVTDEIGEPPVLLLDDVFSELDPERSAALLHSLPAGQAILTTAGRVPEGARVAKSVRVAGGEVLP